MWSIKLKELKGPFNYLRFFCDKMTEVKKRETELFLPHGKSGWAWDRTIDKYLLIHELAPTYESILKAINFLAKKGLPMTADIKRQLNDGL
jgi:hypothetical protein